MKKKGFTLIELLAVIIILAIISLIVTPMISNLIQNARKAASKNSAQGYIDAIKNKISISALYNENMHGTHTVDDIDSILEYSGSGVERGLVIVDGDILKEAKLCVNGYSFKYYSDKLEESNIDYCVDKSNLEITVLGTSIEEELNNQYSYDLDLTSYDISSATNVVCNNNAIPSVTNDTLHITDIYGDTKCSIENSIATTFANLDDTTNIIVMLSDETIDSTLITSASKDVVLDLNGTTITKQGGANDVIESHGYMTINDGLGTGKILNTNTACGRGVVTYGEMILNNVNIEVSGTCAALLIGYTSNPHGTATVNNSTMKGNNTHVIGALSNDNTQLVINDSTIEGGIGRTVSIQGTGNAIINGGTYTTRSGAVIKNISESTVDINGGTYVNEGGAEVITNTSSGTINISDSNSKVYIGNLLSNPESIWTPTAVYNIESGTININGSVADACNENVGSNTSGICIFSYNRSILNGNNATGTININGGTTVSKDFITVNNYTGNININNGEFITNYTGTVNSYGTITNSSTGIININNGTFVSEKCAAVSNTTGITNINGGVFTSNVEITIRNTTTSVLNINQTSTPIYMTSLAKTWRPVILNASTGTINITANQANACTANASDTTSGLCVYAEGDKDFSKATSNTAISNYYAGSVTNGQAVININGGTYYGGSNTLLNSSGTINVTNAKLLSGHSSARNGGTGTINICNSSTNAVYDLYNDAVSTITYNNVTFSDGTNTPRAYNPNGTITQSDTCPISE